ncbi:MAG TPA: transcriptional regulator [Actinobacteria bacterium]|nr:transcriptional regulator [Actinomycetota bacterium]
MDTKIIVYFLPLIILQLALMIAALIDLSKRETVAGGNKLLWLLIIIFINTIGPILYFVIGRKEEQ